MGSAKSLKSLLTQWAEYSYQDSFAMRLGYFNESDLRASINSWLGL
jgi:hypothetical protein